MKRHLSSVVALALFAPLAVGLRHAGAVHNGPELSDEEVQCQLRSQYVMGSFTRRYSKCLTKCAQKAPSRAAAATECPESGACLLGPVNPTCRCLTRARDQAVDGQVGRCFDCPECYAGGSCTTDATSKTDTIASWAEGLFFSDTPAVYCDDTSSVDGLQPSEEKCQQATAKALAFFARAKSLCLRKCRLVEHGGSTPPGSCDAPPAQAGAQSCIDDAEAKAALKINKRCHAITADPPECWSGRTAQEWIDEAEQLIDGEDTGFFCASPSPAFLDDAK